MDTSPSPSPSRWLPFLGGLVLGAVVATVLARQFQPGTLPTVPPEAQAQAQSQEAASAASSAAEALAKAQERVTKLEADNLKLAERVQSLSKATADAAPAKPKKSKEPVNPLAAMFGGEDGGTNEAGKAMRGVMEAAIKQQMEGKMRQLKSKLNLTPEQEESIRGILEKQLGAGRAIAEKMLTGKATEGDMADATQAQGNPEAQIKALLSPEQQAAYDEVQSEELRNNARLMANAELLQMQGALGLNQEQQDTVYKALFEATQEQFSGLGSDPKRAMDFRGNLDRKLNALKGVLTEEQFKSYEEMQQQQLKLIESMLPKGAKSGDAVIPQVQPPTP